MICRECEEKDGNTYSLLNKKVKHSVLTSAEMIHNELKCPACLKSESKVLWYESVANDSKNYSFVKCSYCGLHYVFPIPDASILSLLYCEYSVHQYSDEKLKKAYPALKTIIARWRFTVENHRSLVNWLKKNVAVASEIVSGRRVSFTLGLPLSLSAESNILDVGCGNGNWLLHMQKQGYGNLYGQDVFGSACKRLESFGIPVSTKELCSVGFPTGKFDLVRMEHVLEHVTNPFEYLTEIKRILKPGGRLVVTVPAIESLSYKLSGRCWAALDFPRHLFHFSLDSIKHLASRAGLSLNRYRYLPAFTHFYCSIETSLGGNFYGKPWFKIILLVMQPFYTFINTVLRKGDFLSVELVKSPFCKNKTTG